MRLYRKTAWVWEDPLPLAINRTSPKLPNHGDGAQFAVTIGLPEGVREAPGVDLSHKPGVALLWITRSFRPFRVPEAAVCEAGTQPGLLFELAVWLKISAVSSSLRLLRLGVYWTERSRHASKPEERL